MKRSDAKALASGGRIYQVLKPFTICVVWYLLGKGRLPAAQTNLCVSNPVDIRTAEYAP